MVDAERKALEIMRAAITENDRNLYARLDIGSFRLDSDRTSDLTIVPRLREMLERLAAKNYVKVHASVSDDRSCVFHLALKGLDFEEFEVEAEKNLRRQWAHDLRVAIAGAAVGTIGGALASEPVWAFIRWLVHTGV